jgi:hypothetical protein
MGFVRTTAEIASRSPAFARCRRSRRAPPLPQPRRTGRRLPRLGRASAASPGRSARHGVGRGALRPGGHRRAADHARQPPELFIVLFALCAGEIGGRARPRSSDRSFANALLVLGLAVIAGRTPAARRVMRFPHALPNDTADAPAPRRVHHRPARLSDQVGRPRSEHQSRSRRWRAVVPALVYAPGSGRTCARRAPSPPLRKRALTLRLRPDRPAGDRSVGAAFVSDWFVDALIRRSGLDPKAFTGLVIVAIAGNAVEKRRRDHLAAREGPSVPRISIVAELRSRRSLFLFPAPCALGCSSRTRLNVLSSTPSTSVAGRGDGALAYLADTGDGGRERATSFEGSRSSASTIPRDRRLRVAGRRHRVG